MIPEIWQHQKLAVEKARELQNMALFMGLGTGKTRTMIEILQEKINDNKKFLKTLIIGPAAVVPNWKNEIQKYSNIPSSRVHILDGPILKRARDYTLSDGIYITNFEAFAFEKFASVAIANPPTVLIIDESHRIKSPEAKRTKTLIKVSYAMDHLPISHRFILTGSPVLNTQMDLFSQFLVLDGGRTFGKNFYAFRGKYFRDKNEYMPRQKHFPNWVPRAGADDQLKACIAPLVVQANKDDCLDLPPLVRTELEVELSPSQRKAYEEMKKEFIAFVDGGTAIANLALTKALRMSQILSGFLKLDDGNLHVFQDNPRADTLTELLMDIVPQEKVIVWSVFQQDYQTIKAICDGLKIKYAECTGLTSDKQAELDRFEKDPDCRVMIASQSAGGTGVNMIQASTMIYYSKGYSLEHDMQSEARNYRGGSEIHHKITRIDLVARGTVDDIVLTALRDKKDLSTRILELRDSL